MKKSHHLFATDVSERARVKLEYALQQEVTGVNDSAPRVSVKEARHGAPQAEVVSDRDTTRLLFISQDTTLLNQTTQSLDGYLNLADVFDEVHIVVLQLGLPPRNPVLRVSSNVWLYVVSQTTWWWMPVAAVEMIESQLVFAEGFRPDLIVARDPYESALVAYYIGRQYKRPTQLHVLENVLNKNVQAALPHPRIQSLIARYVLPRFVSIRTSTDYIAATLAKRYPSVPDIETLPRFHNYAAVTHSTTALTLKEKYPQFTFIILYVGTLDTESRAYQAIDAVRGLLQNKKIGLVLCGDGSSKPELQKRAELLGIVEQIVFERDLDPAACLASADVLIVPEATSEGDDVAILGAFARVPLVMVVTQQRSDLFVNGESALLCKEGDERALGLLVSQIVSNITLRRTMTETAYATVCARIHEDPVVYRTAYRDSVEAALFVGNDDVSSVIQSEDTV